MTHHHIRSPRRQRGVTMAELMAVVIVLGLIASVTILNGATSDLARVEAARSVVVRAIRHARDESIRSGEPYVVRVQANSGRVRVGRVDTGVSPAVAIYDVRDPLTKQLWDYRITDDQALAGVSVTRSSNWRAGCNSGSYLVFRDGGTPSCLDPLSTLIDDVTFTLSRGSQQAAVRVEGFISRVHLQ